MKPTRLTELKHKLQQCTSEETVFEQRGIRGEKIIHRIRREGLSAAECLELIEALENTQKRCCCGGCPHSS